MRRTGVATLLALAIVSCAAPEFRLTSRFTAGETREYRVVADAEVTISAADLTTTERTRLEARTRLVVEQVSTEGATLLMTISPRRLTRDGKTTDVPSEQRVRITVATDGRIIGVTAAEGAAPLDEAAIEDLVPLIGPPLPGRRVHLADRWTRPLAVATGVPAGVQNARLSAVRVVDGYDCGIVALSTRRPVARVREIAGTTVRLEGIEYAAGEIAFAFREGFPVSIRSSSEARLAISEGPAAGGGVVIRSVSDLTLLNRSLGS